MAEWKSRLRGSDLPRPGRFFPPDPTGPGRTFFDPRCPARPSASAAKIYVRTVIRHRKQTKCDTDHTSSYVHMTRRICFPRVVWLVHLLDSVLMLSSVCYKHVSLRDAMSASPGRSLILNRLLPFPLPLCVENPRPLPLPL